MKRRIHPVKCHNPLLEPRARGFTLLEVLVAVALVAVVSTLAFLGLDALVQARSQTDEFARHWQQSSRAWYWLRQDISQALSRPTRDENGIEEPAFIGQRTSFQLIRYVPFAWDEGIEGVQALPSPLQKVRWYWQNNRLWRASKNPPELRGPHWQRQAVLALPNAPVFEYQDARGRWHRQWPPARSEPNAAVVDKPLADRSVIPHAIRWQWTDEGLPHSAVFYPLSKQQQEFP